MDLPNMKELTGEANCEEWIDLLRLNLAARGLEVFLDVKNGGVSTAWVTKGQATVSYIMRSSISAKVREDLLVKGWNPKDRDPKALFDAVTALFYLTPLKEEFDTINMPEFRTPGGKLRLDNFVKRLNYLKVRIMDMDANVTEEQCVAAGNMAVRRTIGQFPGGNTWKKLLQQIQGLPTWDIAVIQ
jgi:hypothetical protein